MSDRVDGELRGLGTGLLRISAPWRSMVAVHGSIGDDGHAGGSFGGAGVRAEDAVNLICMHLICLLWIIANKLTQEN
jgi:hypothetical protein